MAWPDGHSKRGMTEDRNSRRGMTEDRNSMTEDGDSRRDPNPALIAYPCVDGLTLR